MQMDKTISEDVGRAVKVGLTVFDDGSKVGYVAILAFLRRAESPSR